MHYYAGMTSEHCLRVITRIYHVPSWCSRALYSPVPLASTASVYNDCPPVSRVLVNRFRCIVLLRRDTRSTLALRHFSSSASASCHLCCPVFVVRQAARDGEFNRFVESQFLLLLYLRWSQKRTFNPWYCRRTFQWPFICFLHTPCQAFTPIYNGGRVRSIEIFFIYLS